MLFSMPRCDVATIASLLWRTSEVRNSRSFILCFVLFALVYRGVDALYAKKICRFKKLHYLCYVFVRVLVLPRSGFVIFLCLDKTKKM